MSKEIDFDQLKKELPYKWRVQSFSKFKPEATCVAYIDSRDVQKLLDEVVGPENWQDEYYEVKNNLFCKIGIRLDGEWTWKGDCGTESNVDKEKGEASDAFKRAAVKWGIGRFLYDLGMHKLPADKKADGSGYPSVVDAQGNKVWDVSKHINELNKKAKAKNTPPPAARQEPTIQEKLGVPADTSMRPNAATADQLGLINNLLNSHKVSKAIKDRITGKLQGFNKAEASTTINYLKGIVEAPEMTIEPNEEANPEQLENAPISQELKTELIQLAGKVKFQPAVLQTNLKKINSLKTMSEGLDLKAVYTSQIAA